MTESHSSPPVPPKIRRKIEAPVKLTGRVLLMLALPLAATLGLLGWGASQRVLRSAIIFGVLLAVFRLLGKRELSRLSPFELVMLMLVPEVLSDALQGDGELVDGLVGLSSLLLLVLATSALSHRFEAVEKVVEASATVVVSNGRLIERALNEERITPEELYGEMHKQGLADVSDVKWALLESTGEITFIPFEGVTNRKTAQIEVS